MEEHNVRLNLTLDDAKLAMEHAERILWGYRAHYPAYEEHVVVFVTALSGKKYQQKAVDTVKNLIPACIFTKLSSNSPNIDFCFFIFD